MKNKNEIDAQLDQTISAIRNEQGDPAVIEASGARVWERIRTEVGAAEAGAVEKIRGCADVQALLPDYRAHTLTPARVLLVEDHLHECTACRHKVEGTRESTAWTSVLNITSAPVWNVQRLAFAAMILVAVGLTSWFGYERYFAVPPGSRMMVQSLEGSVYLVDSGEERALRAGDQLQEGDVLRTAAGSHAFVKLIDGSVVELNERTEMSVKARRIDTTIRLNRGSIIVQAAKRRTGHLYVAAPDCRVSVTGTVFSVNSGTMGSRVAVVEGEVHVDQNGDDTVLHPGDQVSTNAALAPVDIAEEIGWSRNINEHLALLAEFGALQKKFANIQMPGLRYQSNLFPRALPDTVVFAAIPNYGEALAEANNIFQQQMLQSAVLKQWFEKEHGPNGANELNRAIEKLRTLGQYLGDEVAVMVVQPENEHSTNVVMLAEIKTGGLREFIQSEIDRMGTKERDGIRLLDETELATYTPPAKNRPMLVVVTPAVVVAGSDAATIRRALAQYAAGAGQFPATPFGQKVAERYKNGAGLLIAADLNAITHYDVAVNAHTPEGDRARLHAERAGFNNMNYLILERRDLGQQTENRAELAFVGERRGVPSWLAAPAPIGALDYVSEGAALAVGGVAKSPSLMMEDIVAMASANGEQGLAKLESELNLNLHDDLAATLGSDFAFAIDGPVLPTPSWKLVIEVNDPTRLQMTIRTILERANQEAAKENHLPATLEESQQDGRTFYVVRFPGQIMMKEYHYTFADGYMVIAPSRALLVSAIQTRQNGTSLLRSSTFRSLLPSDQNANVSALFFQNLGPVLEPLLAQATTDQAQQLRQLAADSKPSMVAAYGERDRIEVVTYGKFAGFDINSLGLASLLGNNAPGTLRK